MQRAQPAVSRGVGRQPSLPTPSRGEWSRARGPSIFYRLLFRNNFKLTVEWTGEEEVTIRQTG